jgi:hypothetical protein
MGKNWVKTKETHTLIYTICQGGGRIIYHENQLSCHRVLDSWFKPWTYYFLSFSVWQLTRLFSLSDWFVPYFPLTNGATTRLQESTKRREAKFVVWWFKLSSGPIFARMTIAKALQPIARSQWKLRAPQTARESGPLVLFLLEINWPFFNGTDWTLFWD